MFDITKDQLCEVKDEDLRELVARLCEAELRNAGAPVSAVRWSGAHTAPDGGLDVDCRIEENDFSGDFVPRARTGFQVKKPSMPASKIDEEMSPHGQLRPVFSDIARSNGCYIIVSLADDPTGKPETDRREAMRTQIEEVRHLGDLLTRFYGRAELANWLRQHPAVQLWVREKLSISLQGWRPFGRWSITPPGVDDKLICKAGISIVLPGRRPEKLGIERGIDEIRNLVRTSKKALRIVGLSGVGKTRIVQALFEDSVGNNPLDRSRAIYADLGEEPDPSPRQILERLIADARPAILILDNCPSATHSRLAGQVCAADNIQLITVEYDIREDRPEATAVVRINAEGNDIADALVQRRYPDLGRANSRRIAELAGGNARLALVLSEAANEEENLSDFSNAELFKRLFHQRDAPDTSLLSAAEILSLVYSFSISADQDGVDELAVLSRLLDNQCRRKLYRATQTLLDRQLVQKRGNWRAVLPQALSNRLAGDALNNVPVDELLATFQELPNVRLLKSFGKRLGYLHDHEVSREIVNSWVSSGGLLHDIDQFDDDHTQLFLNIAPVAPEAVLSVIEDWVMRSPEFWPTGRNRRADMIVYLLFSLAYDTALYRRSVAVLAKIALAESAKEGRHRNTEIGLRGLFSMSMSGTEAGPEEQEHALRRFLFSEDSRKRQLGFGMLEATFKPGQWVNPGGTYFGAHPRTINYFPLSPEHEEQWYIRFLKVAHEVAIGEDPELSDLVRNLLANELDVLWTIPELHQLLVEIATALNTQQSWLEGWRAVRSIKHHFYSEIDGERLLPGIELLDKLDDMLRPRSLVDEVRIYVLGTEHEQFVLDDEFDHDDEQDPADRACVRARELGMAVASCPKVIDELSSDLFTVKRDYLIEFGRGLASKFDDLQALWEQLVGHLKLAGDRVQSYDVLYGVIGVVHERDKSLAQKFLDEALENRTLCKVIVNLQISIPLDRTGVKRLFRCLGFEDMPLNQFGHLFQDRQIDALSEADIRDLMLKMLDKPDGPRFVLQGLGMRLEALKEDGRTLDSDLKRVGLRASAKLLRGNSGYYRGSTGHDLAAVIISCMDEAEFPEESENVTNAFFARIKAPRSLGRLHIAISALAEKVPFRFLDGVFFDPGLEMCHRREIFGEQRHGKNPLSNIEPTTLLAWCRNGNVQERLSMISEAIYPFADNMEGNGVVFSKQAHAVMEATDDASKVLGNFALSIQPMSCSGSLVSIIAARREPFEALSNHVRSDIRSAVATLVPQICDKENSERRKEQAEDEQRNQRFE